MLGSLGAGCLLRGTVSPESPAWSCFLSIRKRKAGPWPRGRDPWHLHSPGSCGYAGLVRPGSHPRLGQFPIFQWDLEKAVAEHVEGFFPPPQASFSLDVLSVMPRVLGRECATLQGMYLDVQTCTADRSERRVGIGVKVTEASSSSSGISWSSSKDLLGAFS